MTATAPPDLSALADAIEAQVSEAIRMPTLDACRAILNDVQLRRARIALSEAPDVIDRAQQSYRAAQSVHTAARDALATAIVEAEWELDANFHTDANKVYLRLPCDCIDLDGTPDPKCPVCSGLGTTRKYMTADERRTWKSVQAAADPAVRKLAADAAAAEEEVAAARDAIAVANARLSAAKHGLAAAVAEVQVLAIGIQARSVAP